MSDNYLTLEEVKLNKSLSDGTMYKTYKTSFFSYTKARHRIQYLYDKNDNVHFVELYEIIDRKVNPKTNECLIRAELEFLDDEDMDFLLNKPLYFKEPDWFHDLTNEEIVQLDCIFEQYESVLGPITERKNISINADGTIRIDTEKYNVSQSIVQYFFEEIKLSLGSEKTYNPLLCGECNCTYFLHLKSGKVIEYSGNYVLCDGTPYGCERYTKVIVDDFLKVIDSF